MFGLWKTKQESNITTDYFKVVIEELKVRLELIEDDIKRLRKKSPALRDNNPEEDEQIMKSLEDDGFKEIRELQKKHGSVLGE